MGISSFEELSKIHAAAQAKLNALDPDQAPQLTMGMTEQVLAAYFESEGNKARQEFNDEWEKIGERQERLRRRIGR